MIENWLNELRYIHGKAYVAIKNNNVIYENMVTI